MKGFVKIKGIGEIRASRIDIIGEIRGTKLPWFNIYLSNGIDHTVNSSNLEEAETKRAEIISDVEREVD